MRAEQTDFLRFCYTPELTVEAALQPLRRFDMDAAILFSDILVVPDALGRRVTFVEGTGPRLDPIRSPKDVEDLRVEAIDEHLAPVLESVRTLRGELSDEVALIGFAGAPWTVAVYMVEGRGGGESEAIQTWAMTEPESFGRLMDRLVDATAFYLERQVENGAEVLQLFDTWAGLLSETLVRRWVFGPTARIVERLKERYPDVPIIGFPRHIGALCESYVTETKVDGIGIDAGVPLDWARSNLQNRATVQGNLDNMVLVVGNPALAEETVRILKSLSGGPFIFNLGHGVLPKTPVENVAEVAALVHGWRAGA